MKFLLVKLIELVIHIYVRYKETLFSKKVGEFALFFQINNALVIVKSR